MTQETRVYGKAVELDAYAIQAFWDERARRDNSFKSVLLGSDFAEDTRNRRDERETELLLNFIGGKKDIAILDIGCGIGRWAHNLKNRVKIYHGIDFSREFIKSAKKLFEADNRIQFFNMLATQMDTSVLLKCYDLVIITGVAMYINDNDMERLFYYAGKLNEAGGGGGIYFQESISVLESRLTLKDFDSMELNSKYNAIYRTQWEYENYFTRYLPEYYFELSESGLLLDKDTGAREETNAGYWFLRRKK
jgi:SAM-dependent methyltransferase